MTVLDCTNSDCASANVGESKALTSLDRNSLAGERRSQTPACPTFCDDATMLLFCPTKQITGDVIRNGGNDRGQFASARLGEPDRRVKPRSLGFWAPEIRPDPHPIPLPT
ncbi:hypothetical protein ABH999_001644 [Bradyrhizobium yuanmingense]